MVGYPELRISKYMETVQCKMDHSISVSYLENSPTDGFSKDVSSNIFIMEYTLRIHFINDLYKVVKSRVELAQVVWVEAVGFGPMRSALMA